MTGIERLARRLILVAFKALNNNLFNNHFDNPTRWNQTIIEVVPLWRKDKSQVSAEHIYQQIVLFLLKQIASVVSNKPQVG